MGPEFMRFVIAGGIAAIANYGSRFLYSYWLRYEFAIIMAYLTGMVVAFVLMRGHVFESRDKPVRSQVLYFILVNGFAVLQTLLVSVFFAYWLLPSWGIMEHAEGVAHLIGVMVPVITSYYGHKYLTFK